MATNRELEARLKQMEALLAQVGLSVDAPRSNAPEDRPDYIAFGSERHAALLGLVILSEGQKPPRGQRYLLTGEIDGNVYCLEDELGSMRFHPGLSLDEVAPVILQQKIGEFESGTPKVPDSAPPLWTPTPWSEITV